MIVQLFTASGGVVLPVQSPYDNEIVVDHLNHFVQRDGSVALRYGGQTWRVTAAGASRPCRACHDTIVHLSYQLGGAAFCQRCTFEKRRWSQELMPARFAVR